MSSVQPQVQFLGHHHSRALCFAFRLVRIHGPGRCAYRVREKARAREVAPSSIFANFCILAERAKSLCHRIQARDRHALLKVPPPTGEADRHRHITHLICSPSRTVRDVHFAHTAGASSSGRGHDPIRRVASNSQAIHSNMPLGVIVLRRLKITAGR